MTTDTRLGGEPELDEDRLPWLEAAEEEETGTGVSITKLVGLLILGVLLLGSIVGGYSWWSQRGATGGGGEMIAAAPGPYKVKPADPGGMDVEGEGDTAFATSEGTEPQGRIDMAAVPEAPMVKAEPKPAPATKPAAGKQAPAALAAAPQLASGGSSIQLGAFSSEASANNAWKALSTRFAYLEPLTHSVIPVQTGDRTLYRLRANGAEAANICGRLRIAGETCVTVN